jgi:hypothetical protein
VLWVFLSFAFGGIAQGFFARIGELIADHTIASAPKLKLLGSKLSELMHNQQPENRGDIIFGIPLLNSKTVVEAAIESVNETSVEIALGKLSEVYAEASRLIAANREDYFDQIKYIFNPRENVWEVNYLIIKSNREIILGPRYYDANHPLNATYLAFKYEIDNTDFTQLGTSIGGTITK